MFFVCFVNNLGQGLGVYGAKSRLTDTNIGHDICSQSEFASNGVMVTSFCKAGCPLSSGMNEGSSTEGIRSLRRVHLYAGTAECFGRLKRQVLVDLRPEADRQLTVYKLNLNEWQLLTDVPNRTNVRKVVGNRHRRC